MNGRPRLAQLATDRLAAEHVASVTVDPEAEARTIALMATRIETAGTKRRFARAAAVLSLAAAVALAAGGAWVARHHAPGPSVAVAPRPAAPAPVAPAFAPAFAQAVEGDAVVVHDGVEAKLSVDTRVTEGDRVVARPGAHASVRLATGARLGLEPGAELAIVHQGLLQAFALDAGSIRADVAGLAAGERFVVTTRDAEVEGRETSFRVSASAADPCTGASTRVEVLGGTVVVRSAGKEERVAAGGHWPADCATASPARHAPRPRHGARPTRALTAQEQSELTAQTRIFGAGLAAKKGGDARAAAARFDDYLARYPDGALAEAAAAQRFEVLAAFDRPRAVAAARAYLQRWPGGFRRDEAAAIVAGAP